jgi:ketosteroid isomerase-like protein
MSQENVEIVCAVIEAVNRGDRDAALREVAPDFELDLSRSVAPNRGVYTLEQLPAYSDEFLGIWASSRMEPHEFIDAGEHVVVPGTFHAMGRDGVEVRARATWSFTVRDGAIERICMYQERREALKAAGLSE